MGFEEWKLDPAFKVTLERARSAARIRRHPEATMLHLIYSLTEDPGANDLFNSKGIDPAAIRQRSLDLLRKILPVEPTSDNYPDLSPDVSNLVERTIRMVQIASFANRADGHDVLGVIMDDADNSGDIKEQYKALIEQDDALPASDVSSSAWTGRPSRTTLSTQQSEELIHELSELEIRLDGLNIKNSEKEQAYAYIVAAKVLAKAPDPPGDIIWELIGRLNAIAGIAGLLVAVIALMK